MKLKELLPQLHNKITYFICLSRVTNVPTLNITKTTNTKTTKLPLLSGEVDIFLLVGRKTMLLGTAICSVVYNEQEIVEYKHNYIKFNKNIKSNDWYITQTKQGLVNAIKILFKKYKLPLSTYKYLINRIKNCE
jgi:hypothetical protein